MTLVNNALPFRFLSTCQVQ